jgi:hypothetical protein
VDPLELEPYAARLCWRFAEAQSLETWQALFTAFLDQVAQACTAAGGPRVIGHIKGLMLLPGGGFLRGSVVSARYPPQVEISRAASGTCAELEMALNVLVYGLPLTEAQQLVPEAGQRLARRWGAVVDVVASNHHRS